MKKILALSLCLGLLVCLAACNKEPGVSSQLTTTSTDVSVLDDSSNTVTTSPATSVPTSAEPSSSKISTSKKPPASITVNSNTLQDDYAGAYLEDNPPAELNYTYESLKKELNDYVSTHSPDSKDGDSDVYNLTSNFKKYSIFGYYAADAEQMSVKVTAKNGKVESFTCIIKMAYRDRATPAAAIKRDVEKLKKFDTLPVSIFVLSSGNPAPYPSVESLPTKITERMFKGNDSEWLNVTASDGTISTSQFHITCSRKNNKTLMMEHKTIIYFNK